MEQTLDAAEALHNVAEVRRPRQLLTARAMGLIWMVWSLAFAVAGFGGLAGIMTDGPVPLWYDAVTAGAPVLLAAVASQAIWRAHALQRDPRANPLHATLAVLVFLLTAGLLNVLHGTLIYREGALVFGRLALVAAWTALLFTFLARKRVSMAPGLVGAVGAAVVYAVATTADVASPEGVLFGNMAVIMAVMVVFAGIGLWTFARG